MDSSDIETIRASWLCARQDNISSGCLLFKRLFEKHPDYLPLFAQFPDLDLERMRENRRLLKHAVKVIDTVSFVVDSLGDQQKSSALNEALVNLVKSHLRRQIGLEKFQNLGIVLIEFICELNQSQLNGNTMTTTAQHNHQPIGVDTKSLRTSWAKLYDVILDLVKREEATAAATTATTKNF